MDEMTAGDNLVPERKNKTSYWMKFKRGKIVEKARGKWTVLTRKCFKH